MNKKLTSNEIKELSPLYELKTLLDSKAEYAFGVTNKADILEWQNNVRSELINTLGFIDDKKVLPNAELLQEVDRGDFIHRKYIIDTARHSKMPFYLLIPKEQKKASPLVIALAGHGYGARDIVGIWEDDTFRDTPDGYHRDFAISICKSGFVVAVPEIACFGEREATDRDMTYSHTTCDIVARQALTLGKSVLGMRVRDNMRLLDYLTSLDIINKDKIGIMGISGGGMLSFFTSCIDTRIKATVVSGYFSTFKESVLSISHCLCNFVPGLYKFGEMYDLANLILPRAMCVESGTKDDIFPIESVKGSFEKLKNFAKIHKMNVEDDLVLDVFEGRHRINGEKAFKFLSDKLK